ncbi:MAG: DUF4827 domain-containing protein [Prevotella sp.]|nr:DUF4827 domain-containing protein [Prevotella sp.]
MNRICFLFLAIAAMICFMSCDDNETYADQKKKERTAIKQFLLNHKINVISEQEFKVDTVTDVSKNEYVLFDNTGVYMQIVRKGCGEKIKNGETVNVLCRFKEYNVFTDSLILTNNNLYNSSLPDKMAVSNTLGTFTAQFVSGVMYSQYQSSSVPAGWLIPLTYINIGRYINEGDELARVNLIVPHSQGTANATANVYPCYYEITYERGI